MAGAPPEAGDLDAFELQLRKLAGVVAVGFRGSAQDRVVHVSVTDPEATERTRAEADELARLYLGRPVWLIVSPAEEVEEVDEAEKADKADEAGPVTRRKRRSRAAGEAGAASEPNTEHGSASVGLFGGDVQFAIDPGLRSRDTEASLADGGPLAHRVELSAVRRHPDGNVEVVLSYEDRRAGALSDGRPGTVAEATIRALEDLGFPMPFEVSLAIRLGVGVKGAVTVVLSGTGGERLGVARASTPEEATAKATLQALNRYLDDPRLQTRPD